MSSQSTRTLVHLSTGLSTGISGYVIGRNQNKYNVNKYENIKHNTESNKEQIHKQTIDISKIIMWRAID